MEQFLRSIHRYVQIGVHIKGYYSQKYQRFHREVAEVTEFYVDKDNNPKSNTLYKKTPDGKVILRNPSEYLLGYLESQGVIMPKNILVKEEFVEPSDNISLNNNSISNNLGEVNNQNYVNNNVVYPNQNMSFNNLSNQINNQNAQ